MLKRTSIVCLRSVAAVALLAAVSYIPQSSPPDLQASVPAIVLPAMPSLLECAPVMEAAFGRFTDIDPEEAYGGGASDAPLHAEAPCAPLPDPDEYPASRIGYLEHRGRAYPIEALTDPEWAELSEDPFIRGFMDSRVYAKDVAGLTVEAPSVDANWTGQTDLKMDISIQPGGTWAGSDGVDWSD